MKNIEPFFPDHFTQLERRGVLASLIMSVIAMIVLVNVRPQIGKRDNKIVAEIVSFKNNVKFKDGQSLSFYEVSSSEKLQNHDVIYTGNNSAATVKFLNSNTQLKIPASSLVEIVIENDELVIEVREGGVEVLLGKNEKLNLRSKDGLKTFQAGDKGAQLKAYIQANGIDVYSKDFKSKVPFEVLSPYPDEQVSETKNLNIETNKSSQYKVQIAKTANFKNDVLNSEFTGTKLSLPIEIEDGTYYLKISEKYFEKIIRFQVITENGIEIISPKEDEAISLSPGDKVKLSWVSTNAKSYQVKIKNDLKETETFKVDKNEIEIGNLIGNELEWIVAPEVAEGKYSRFSKRVKNSLHFIGSVVLTKDKLRDIYSDRDKKIEFDWINSPKGKYVVNLRSGKNEEIILTKNSSQKSIAIPMPTKGQYKLEVASLDYPGLARASHTFDVRKPVLLWDKKMPKEIKSSEQDEVVPLKYLLNADKTKIDLNISFKGKKDKSFNEKKLALNNLENVALFGFGEYCFTAETKLADDYMTNSEPHCLKLVEIPVFTSIPKPKDIILELAKVDGANVYKINIPKVEKAERYYVEIYKNFNGYKRIYSGEENSPTFLWKSNRSGIYYLRYKVYDNKGRESKFSKYSKLIFPISPLSEW